MAKYIIDTDAGTITEYKETTDSSILKSYQMILWLDAHRGVTEYNGVVADIQRWYYGTLIKAAWCATAVSYLLNMVGITSHKSDNVNRLRLSLMSDHYNGVYYEGEDIPKVINKGDILFWLWEGSTMTDSSSKHVGLAEYRSDNDTIYCIGGNQRDKICTLAYDRKKLYAVYRLAR